MKTKDTDILYSMEGNVMEMCLILLRKNTVPIGSATASVIISSKVSRWDLKR